jgi:hypothetical protein
MPSSVRPSMRQKDSRRPVWEFADQVQITQACSKHCGKPWLSQLRLADCCAIPSVAIVVNYAATTGAL